MTVGTVAYAAPEQLMGQQLDGRADQYALAATAFHLLTGTPLFQHSNPAVVISQHLTADPPPIGTRRPALSDLGPVFSKALAKDPADRYDSCVEFVDALSRRLGEVAAESGATEATSASPIAAKARHRSRPQRVSKDTAKRRPAVIVAVILALLLLGVSALAFMLFHEERSMSASPTQAPGTPVVPVVMIGADCATLGAEGVSSKGMQAYCSKLPSTGDAVWSIYTSAVPTPSAGTPGPTDEVYPAGIEQQVRVCVEETHQTRIKCREDIRQGNIYGPA
jgi:serine/threonine-protein kinase